MNGVRVSWALAMSLVVSNASGCRRGSESGGQETSSAGGTGSTGPGTDSGGQDTGSEDARLVAINISPASDDDEARAVQLALGAGVNATMIGFSWSEIEAGPGGFEFGDVDRQNAIYGSTDLEVTLMLNPIETDWRSVPSDLEGVAFDDPRMISRFNEFASKTLEHLPDVDIQVVLIGNEVNAYLFDHDEWDAYQTLYAAAGVHLRELRPDLEIGVETMFEGMTDQYPEKIKALNATSDMLALTYYPAKSPGPDQFPHPDVSVIEAEISALVETYPEHEIHIIETGFPTSAVVGSSQDKQVQFVREMFRVWNAHTDRIEFVSFFMLHDFSVEFIEALFQQLGLDDHPNYEEILAAMTSLGFRTWEGQDKLAFPVLREEIQKVTQ